MPGDVVQAWLRRARSDLELARLALQAGGVLPEDTCFHAQQCAEKALKALLPQAGDDPSRTHAIDVLPDRLKVRGMHIPDSAELFLDGRPFVVLLMFVFIHAFRAGRRHAPPERLCRPACFNPRLPRGKATFV